MPSFRKKPVVIEAVLWTGKNLREVITFTDGPPDTRSMHAGMKWEDYTDLVLCEGLTIFTLEGKMLASPGDWIIRGVQGEHYPCKPDIFAATYEPVAEPVKVPSDDEILAIIKGNRHPYTQDQFLAFARTLLKKYGTQK